MSERLVNHLLIAGTLLVVGCAGSAALPPRPDQGPQADLLVFDSQSWHPNQEGGVSFDTLAPDVGPPPCALTCKGCCDANDVCRSGTADEACGRKGQACADCLNASTRCEKGVCAACQPRCVNKLCGAADGCGSTCDKGSGCCTPSCANKSCGDGDGCGGKCSGLCPWKYVCSSKTCVCGPSKHFEVVDGRCLPSCGRLLAHLSLGPGACCNSSCKGVTAGGGPNQTWDCTYCCATACK